MFSAPSVNKNVKRYVESFSWTCSAEKHAKYILDSNYSIKNVFSVKFYISRWAGSSSNPFAGGI